MTLPLISTNHERLKTFLQYLRSLKTGDSSFTGREPLWIREGTFTRQEVVEILPMVILLAAATQLQETYGPSCSRGWLYVRKGSVSPGLLNCSSHNLIE